MKTEVIAICRDGGTKHVLHDGREYYIDGRIGSSTRGKSVHTGYPADNNRLHPEMEKAILEGLAK